MEDGAELPLESVIMIHESLYVNATEGVPHEEAIYQRPEYQRNQGILGRA